MDDPSLQKNSDAHDDFSAPRIRNNSIRNSHASILKTAGGFNKKSMERNGRATVAEDDKKSAHFEVDVEAEAAADGAMGQKGLMNILNTPSEPIIEGEGIRGMTETGMDSEYLKVSKKDGMTIDDDEQEIRDFDCLPEKPRIALQRLKAAQRRNTAFIKELQR